MKDNSGVRELANMEALIISAMLNDGEYPVENVGKHATQIAKILTFNGYAITKPLEPQVEQAIQAERERVAGEIFRKLEGLSHKMNTNMTGISLTRGEFDYLKAKYSDGGVE
uniref:Uncharacterized protein n=1 Tax=viral metagenome TaxID=1070528 RepID=A0A6H2A3G0_9ZZZZ